MSVFDEAFHYFTIKKDGFSCSDQVLDIYRSKARARILVRLLGCLSSGVGSYMFFGLKYRDIAASLASVVVAGGLKEYIYARLNGYGYFAVGKYYKHMVNAFEKRSDKQLNALIDDLSKKIKQTNIQYFVVVNDSLPFERALILACRRAGVKAIYIQHGIFSSTNHEINDGKYADLIHYYDNSQREILYSTGAKDVKVFEYYRNVERKKWCGNKALCILGQPYSEYYKNKSKVYVRLLQELICYLDSAEIEWVYKAHPSENLSML